ncbi:MAG: hypothetical protein IPG75_20610 [Gemmatimonadetes bacterium]|nr:hypothetical protein [Gemmatimonadota bacterium]
MSQRVGDLRRNLNEWEGRFSALAAGAEAITGAAARADALTAQVGELGGELGRITELGARARAGLSDLERLEENIGGLTERTCRLEDPGRCWSAPSATCSPSPLPGRASATRWSSCAPRGRR